MHNTGQGKPTNDLERTRDSFTHDNTNNHPFIPSQQIPKLILVVLDVKVSGGGETDAGAPFVLAQRSLAVCLRKKKSISSAMFLKNDLVSN